MKLVRENPRPRPAARGRDEIVGRSLAMRQLLRDLKTVGRSDAAVLIEGETGVGKNMIARTLHRVGPRAEQPFVALSAANLPEPLFESELFGHVKGAFSGAVEHHKGLARAADGGTLFIDEVGELTPANQAKLLCFLDQKEVRPVGGVRSTQVDLRVISATNQDLQELVRRKAFRRDLYYRVRVLALRVPSLRERREDVPLLARHFLKRFNQKYGKSVTGLSAEAMARLWAHDWEGNVRELENELERAVVLTPEGQEVHADSLQLCSATFATEPQTGSGSMLRESRSAAERSVILQSLKRHRWNVSAVARELGISRVGLTRKLKRLGIVRPGHEVAS